MNNFTKYYSYNQVIENFDVLIMTEQEYLANKDKLDNPQRVVIVNRAGGPREPKIPKWFQSYKKEVNDRFEKIEEQLNGSKPPKWFKQWAENVYEKKQPKWFTTWCEEKFDPLVKRIDNLVQKNNLKE